MDFLRHEDGGKMDLCAYTKKLWEIYCTGTFEKEHELLSILDENFVAVCAGKNQHFHSAKQFGAFLKQVHGKDKSVPFHYRDFWCEEQVLSPDIHLVYGGVSLWWELPQTELHVDFDNTFTMVYRKTAGEWKLAYFHHIIPDVEQMTEEKNKKPIINQIRMMQNHVEELQSLAAKDVLTGLLNLRSLQNLFRMSNRANSWMILVDIDDFKSVNDTYGHPVGDKVLKKVADILRSSVRGNDIVVRLGGDEFVVLFSNIQEEQLKKRLEQMMMETEKAAEDLPGLKSLSIGAIHVHQGETLENAVQRADDAMYEIKKNGKNGYRIA